MSDDDNNNNNNKNGEEEGEESILSLSNLLFAFVTLAVYIFFIRPTPTARNNNNDNDNDNNNGTTATTATTPTTTTTTTVARLHEAALDSFYKHRKGGVVVSCSKKYMLAVEFDGPYGSGGLVGCCQETQKCAGGAKDLGTHFLMGETVKYIKTTDENSFFDLLQKYKRGASTQGLIDMKSGLRLYEVKITR
ncbi:hypothetical protein FRACYDRAFT_250231 [Fragilariopsis cylindrus CCMP1102]|uniref:Uncharacterized protein n=1 Tax=Fragilariopsis cylindrus CCMP1102 TaxID=635003 RepID=A0A1E7EQ07_9STRA|nr:hypothetical protein FRACYDRAFT_250231 [Fragilariopsis cylindrus CCMP1102]|eukprot:OEU08011.1 hypothetical protein FRACYDRAFT_250231 [Fragilariopsis cylindrus CCMP1102]